MRYLLDTHSLLWLATNSSHLSTQASNIIGDVNNSGCFSTISLWELGIKASIGKLILPSTPQQLEERATDEGLRSIPLTSGIVSRMMTLPWHHKDPFDRIIVATALEEGLTLISKDDLLRHYGLSVLW
jgi:PIN domain nuclease of toxin-antitoxin system